jgi:sterol desaturase/sphingolipid hydroxylase (fatty acid hydroxylase superfamily)
MGLSDWITEQVILLATSIGLDKNTIKAAFASYGFDPLWDLLRDTYLSPFAMLFAVPLFLILGRIWPGDKNRPLFSKYFVMDFLYPVLALPVQVTLIVTGISLINKFFEAHIPFLHTGLVNGQPLVVQGLAAVLVVDLMFYVGHWLKHKVPWLWYVHSVHHSQRHLNPFTTFRNHPFELLIDAAIKTVPVAIIGGSRPTWLLFALVDGVWGYYIHSNIRTNLGPLKYIIVTPWHHKFHHTIEPEQIDKNFGERFTVWDWLFGTQSRDFDVYPDTGVKGLEWIEEKGAGPLALIKAWLLQFIYPFWMIGRDLRRVSMRFVGRFDVASPGE